MLAEITALNEEWRAAERRAAAAEAALMNANRSGVPATREEIERVFALRAEASARLRVFLTACERASRAARIAAQ